MSRGLLRPLGFFGFGSFALIATAGAGLLPDELLAIGLSALLVATVVLLVLDADGFPGLSFPLTPPDR